MATIMRLIAVTFVLAATMASTVLGQLPSGWKAHDLNRPQPPIISASTSPGGAPSDAVVLFDGKDLSAWRTRSGSEAKWKIVDGAMESVPGSGYVFTKEEFGDCQVHVEFASPKTVKGNGQGRGNSGVFLMGEFEVQVLDSFENKTYADGMAGAIYGQYPPLVNASRGPGQWQSYDIIFKRPRFDDVGNLESSAAITVLHNGVVIQHASPAYGPTSWIQHKGYSGLKEKKEGPLGFQDHGNPVRYRNVWVRRLEPRPAPESPYKTATYALTEKDMEAIVGEYQGTRVKKMDDHLALQFAGAWLQMIPQSATEFAFEKSAGSVQFELDENGRSKSFTLKLDAAGQRKGERKSSE